MYYSLFLSALAKLERKKERKRERERKKGLKMRVLQISNSHVLDLYLYICTSIKLFEEEITKGSESKGSNGSENCRVCKKIK